MTVLSQRDMIREIVAITNNRHVGCQVYAMAEAHGWVERRSNMHELSAYDYAMALFADADRKGWLTAA